MGNCVTCGTLRAIQIQRAVAGGDKRKPTTDEALALYRAWSGYDGTPATDVGTRSDVAAARWASEGVQWGEQWLDVPIIVGLNPAILSHLQAAIAFFG
ncbi:MAG: hypothetical protein P4L77_13075, partial [Sulfuriferula sp.]|nr:hypothetical protein [Sulfuriferula sp.]